MSVLVLNYLISLRTKTPGPGAQSALRALARSGMKIGRIGEFRVIRLTLYIFIIHCNVVVCISALGLMQQLLRV